MENLTWSEADAGCIVPGHYGQYGCMEVINLAIASGWNDEDAKRLVEAEDDEREMLREFEVDIADEAEAWMNDNIAPEGYSFGWHDGEFFLWSDGAWEEIG